MNTKKNKSISDYLKKNNFKRFSLFFGVAFLFLIFSKLSSDYKQTIKLKINLTNLDDEILLKNDSTNYVQAYVEAKGFSLLPLIFKNAIELNVNAKSDVTLKSSHFKFDVQKHKYLIESQLGNSYKLLSVLPDTLLISYSERASKVVPITLKHSINYAVGYDLNGDFKFNKDSIKIVGPAGEVQNINSISTEELVLNNIKSDFKKSIVLDDSGFGNIELFPKLVTVSAKVSRFTEGTIEVPIVITNQPNNVQINYFPKTVSLSYYVDLEKYNAVKIMDFEIECDYAELDDNQTYLVPKVVKKPEFVKYISIKQKRIDFIKL